MRICVTVIFPLLSENLLINTVLKKSKFKRGNTAPFMNQQLQKQFIQDQGSKKRLNQNPTADNRSNFKKPTI